MRENEQLKELQAQYASRSIVMPISQVNLTICSEDDAFRRIQMEIIEWIREKWNHPGELPEELVNGKNYYSTEDVELQSIRSIALGDYWGVKFDNPDNDVPNRKWIVEIGVAKKSPGEVLFGCRVQCASARGGPIIVRSLPSVVKRLFRAHSVFLDGRPYSGTVWKLGEEETDALVRFLKNKERKRPVVVISRTEEYSDLINSTTLADRTAGVAHVVEIGARQSYEVSERIGRIYSVYNGAVRTYHAGFSEEHDNPYSHPLATASRIQAWGSENGPAAFQHFLIDSLVKLSVDNRAQNEIDLPRFADVRAFQRKARNENQSRTVTDSELLRISLEENRDLSEEKKAQKDEYDSLLEMSESERVSAEQERDELRDENTSLRWRIEHLENSLDDNQKTRLEPDYPNTFDGLEEWCKKHLTGHVYIHRRALRAARKSHFENPELAYQALWILRSHYVPMRRNSGEHDRKSRFEEELKKLRLHTTPTFASPSGYGEFGDTYRIEYWGRKLDLNMHLKGSDSRDPRYGFRLYYCWDEDTRQVIVGYFPGHLTTNAS